MRISTKGQITIPRAIRQAMGLAPEDELVFRLVGQTLCLSGASARRPHGSLPRGDATVKRLAGTATTALSTDELLALMRR